MIRALFDYSEGKKFWKDGDRYEGEFKDGICHGQGKK